MHNKKVIVNIKMLIVVYVGVIDEGSLFNLYSPNFLYCGFVKKILKRKNVYQCP